MAITVQSVAEEYEYLRNNPHKCSPFAKGEWVRISQQLTFNCTDLLTVKCKRCNYETVFEFDISSTFPPNILALMKKMGKQ